MHFRPFILAQLAATLAFAQQVTIEQLLERSELSELASILEDLPAVASIIQGAQDIVIFAPNNDAFAAADLDGLSESELVSLLSYHVSTTGAPQASTDLELPLFVPTLFGELSPDSDGKDTPAVGYVNEGGALQLQSGLANRVNIVDGPVNFGTGVAYIIDGVLDLPMSAADTLSAADLTALAEQLTEADLVSTVSDLQMVTVFAPNNAAFEAIESALQDLESNDVTNLLLYHVASDQPYYARQLADIAGQNQGILHTLGGDVVVRANDDGELFINSARVIESDIILPNGVVHVLDAVLNPDNTTVDGTFNEEPTPAFEGAEQPEAESAAAAGPGSGAAGLGRACGVALLLSAVVAFVNF